MKGYCVDVRGFSVDKKRLVIESIGQLTGNTGDGLEALPEMNKIGNVFIWGKVADRIVWGEYEMSENQRTHEISFNDLMLEAGFNYEDNGVEDFKCIDWSEREVTENKPTSNKTRPQITREQYDAVMVQSDKRTFTKALDDLLSADKEQLLDESAIGINELEVTNDFLNKAVDSWRESWERAHNSKVELKAKLEKQKRTLGVISLLLIFSLAAQLAVIFLGG